MTEEIQLDYRELQKIVEQLLPGEFPFTFEELVTRFMSGESGGIGGMVRELAKWLMATVTFPAEHGVKLLFLVIFSALFTNLSKAFSREGTAHAGFLCVYLLLAVHALNGFMASFFVATEAMENISGFAGVLLPVYCISIAVVTGSVTAAGYLQGTVC